MFRPTSRTALVGASLAIALVGLVRVWTGPVVIVQVTTLDEHGERIPAAGEAVEIWTRWGIMSALANDEGRAVFWRVPRRSGFRPSLGPGDMPSGRQFGLFTTPTIATDPGCPEFVDRSVRNLGWLWQRVEIERPATAALRFEPTSPATAQTRRWLTLTFPDSPGRRVSRPIPATGSFCVFAEPVDVVWRSGSNARDPALHTWPTVTPRPGETVVLNLPADD